VAKNPSYFVKKLGKGTPLPAFLALSDEFLAYNAIHL
jgi:hypothetical protein